MQLVTIAGDIRQRVDAAFGHLIGQEMAISKLKRAIGFALAQVPPVLDETILLSGPKSTGKSTLARIVGNLLGVPFTEIAGNNIRTPEQFVAVLETCANAADQPFARSGESGGMPIYIVPSMCVLVEESHMMSFDFQNALLTLLDPKSRRVVVNHPEGKRVIHAPHLCVLLATTHQFELAAAFRSRCAEIKLRSYTIGEVAEMLLRLAPMIGDETARLIASLSRALPRQAEMMLAETFKESSWSGNGDLNVCVRKVGREIGIVTTNGLTINDVRYLKALHTCGGRAGQGGRPIAFNTLASTIYDLEDREIADDIEPWLISLGYIEIAKGGRKLARNGQLYIEDYIEEQRRRSESQREPVLDGRRAAAGERE